MYIAIEGIKGSGKSTIIQDMLNVTNNLTARIDLYAFTRPMCPSHPLELLHLRKPCLKNDDDFIERLFLERAKWNQGLLDFRIPHILGDRSIVTACVTRWNKWNDPYFTIEKTLKDYSRVLQPNVIVWLKTPVSSALNNIFKRPSKTFVTEHETSTVLNSAADAYEELFIDQIYKRKIGKVQIIEVNNDPDIKETEKEIQSIIKFYTKS